MAALVFEYGQRKISMAWWVAVFKDRDGSTEELEVSTGTTLQYEAWNKVTKMFPNKELLQLKSGDELPSTLEEWNSRS